MTPLVRWYCCHPSFTTLSPPLVSVTHSLLVLLPSLELLLSLIQVLLSHWALKCRRSLRFAPWLSSLLLFLSRSQYCTPTPPAAAHMLLCCLDTDCSKSSLASITSSEAPHSQTLNPVTDILLGCPSPTCPHQIIFLLSTPIPSPVSSSW